MNVIIVLAKKLKYCPASEQMTFSPDMNTSLFLKNAMPLMRWSTKVGHRVGVFGSCLSYFPELQTKVINGLCLGHDGC
jgi:hypothetical protein